MNETKEHILKTSLMLFLQKSYKDVTMKEIVEKTGLSKGAFYHYFTSKEELLKKSQLYFLRDGAVNYSIFPTDSLNAFIRFMQTMWERLSLNVTRCLAPESKEKISINFLSLCSKQLAGFPSFSEFERKQHEKDIVAWEQIIKHCQKNR
ncbi:MAG: TetR/AcrR family transcriptional regulator [Ignavibacteriales bacterium]|nr:TetR/AcrR family transcriptional regulator [Ignavibacteriales bacterium]